MLRSVELQLGIGGGGGQTGVNPPLAPHAVTTAA